MNWKQFIQNESANGFKGVGTEIADETLMDELSRRRGARMRRVTARRGPVRRPATRRFPFRRFPRVFRFPFARWNGATIIRDRTDSQPPARPDKSPAEQGASSSSTTPEGASQDAGNAPAEGSEQVRWIQNNLNQVMNLQLAVDGVMKPEIRDALRSFQQQHGLPVDGILGPETERALSAASRGSASSPSTPESPPDSEPVEQEWEDEVTRSSREDVKWVQRSLNRLMGLRLTVDGISGPMTRNAIRQFQRRKRLGENGTIDSPTEAALISSGAGSPPNSTSSSSAVSSGWSRLFQSIAGQTASMPPVEGPYKGVTGVPCANGRGKCWKSATRDIIDADAPWNHPSNRSAANYARVLDYLNVENEQNQRYARRQRADGKWSTYCNIYAHDATRMMWASIPHWIPDVRKSIGWNELSANRTFDWMKSNSRTIGWVHIDDRMCQWLREQLARQQSIPYSDPSVPEPLLIAGSQISASNHSDPGLLSQPSYVAQQFANLGLPTVIIFKNPKTGRSGHLAMVRPETANSRGQMKRNRFVPRSAQAGAKNFRDALATWITGSSPTSPNLMFYVHA
jgi:peptidoglycan hydrolase-like protein with peptidoglycan-binding domain